MPIAARKKPGRPAFEPTDAQRRLVEGLASRGSSVEDIAQLVEISEPTLRKHFHYELRRGLIKGRALNSQRLAEAAAKGNVTAMIWLDKTRYGFREADAIPKKELVNEAAQTAADGTRWQGLLQ